MEIIRLDQRATVLTVNKTVGGESIKGYPRTYKVCDPFKFYLETTTDAIARMSIEEYEKRIEAFAAYVESIETGLTINRDEAYKKPEIVFPTL